MISRSAIKRGSQLAFRRQVCPHARSYASPATGAAATTPASYEQTDIAGIKVAFRDAHGPTTRLAVVAPAGTRFQPLPGLTVGLEEFAYKNTQKRSALRINRESELLGGQLKAYHDRENIILEAAFLREDLAYFSELLAEVISQTKYTTHEFHEAVEPIIHARQANLAHDALTLALDGAHAVAFHTGLGSPLYPTGAAPLSHYLNENSIAAFADAAYTKPSLRILADGATQAGLSKWIEPFFKSIATTSSSSLKLPRAASTYYGGEQRAENASGNALVIAFPTQASGSAKPETAVLAALLGGESSVKWSPGFTLLSKAAAKAPGAHMSAKNYSYSDAGLLTIQVTGSSRVIRKAAEEAVKALQSVSANVSKEDLTKAIAKAKFDGLTQQELSLAGLLAPPVAVKALESVTAEKVQAAAKALLDGKASVSAVGDLYAIPYASELGLKV